jgi:hypothetical protein
MLRPAPLPSLLFALGLWFGVAAPPLEAQDPAPNLTGVWAFSVVTENGTGTPSVTLLQEGETLSGTYVSDRMGARRLEGWVRGDSVHFRLETDPSAGVVMTFIGRVQGDGGLAGIVDFGGMGGATFTARRQPSGQPSSSARAFPSSMDLWYADQMPRLITVRSPPFSM